MQDFLIVHDTKSLEFCREVYRFLMEDERETLRIPADAPAFESGTEPMLAMPEAVDLGLPSGTLWADRNIGAVSPEDAGLFFSWGNVDGHVFGKICDFSHEAYESTPGSALQKDIAAECDAATVNLGKPWQMPSMEDFKELFDNCTCKFVSQNENNGVRLISRINGKQLFFPCSGFCSGSSWYDCGSSGFFWASSFYSVSNARSLFFRVQSSDFNCSCVDPQDYDPQNYISRYYGFPVRPVQKEKAAQRS